MPHAAAHRRLGNCLNRGWRASRYEPQSSRYASASTNIRATNNISHDYDDNTIRHSLRFRTGKDSRRNVGDSRVPEAGFRIRTYPSGGGKREAVEQAKRLRTDGQPTGQQQFKSQSIFVTNLKLRLRLLEKQLKDIPLLQDPSNDREVASGTSSNFREAWDAFTKVLLEPESEQINIRWGRRDHGYSKLLQDLRSTFDRQGPRALDDKIRYAFYGHVLDSRFTPSDHQNQRALADLRYPTEWYPASRTLHRKIHLHVGPTNSGKTYHALQRLEQAETGVYAGPLRLLAHEVYTRLNAKGKPCALITGEERRLAEGKEASECKLSSCTVEMTPLNTTLDVAVIDEIQMIGNEERGWAWTQALLGLKASEIHLCGEERTVPLIRSLCASVGEEVVVHRYNRLTPLQMAEHSFKGSLMELRKGDCIVSFTVMGIHALRREIERTTGRKVATVYGSLPPETRAQQARLFNDPDNEYDFLVASDAVGMGLNLAIKRIVFETASKFDGFQRRTLSVADIKQIAGRAGRYRTAAQDNKESESEQSLASAKADALPAKVMSPSSSPPPASSENIGIVTTLESFDFPIVSAAMSSEPAPITSAGLFPPANIIERFSSYFPPRTPFSYILMRLHEISQMNKRFHLCALRDHIWIADTIESVRGLTVTERAIICASPASIGDLDMWKKVLPTFARHIAQQSSVSIADIKELPLELLEAEVSGSREYLRELERLHKGIISYLWLGFRFAGVFNTRALAMHAKALVEEKIEAVLSKFSFNEARRRMAAERRERQVLQAMEAAISMHEENGAKVDAEGTVHERLNDGPGNWPREPIAEGVQTAIAEQTSLTSGGDRFSGEEDIDYIDPDLEAELPEKQEPAGRSPSISKQG